MACLLGDGLWERKEGTLLPKHAGLGGKFPEDTLVGVQCLGDVCPAGSDWAPSTLCPRLWKKI